MRRNGTTKCEGQTDGFPCSTRSGQVVKQLNNAKTEESFIKEGRRRTDLILLREIPVFNQCYLRLKVLPDKEYPAEIKRVSRTCNLFNTLMYMTRLPPLPQSPPLLLLLPLLLLFLLLLLLFLSKPCLGRACCNFVY